MENSYGTRFGILIRTVYLPSSLSLSPYFCSLILGIEECVEFHSWPLDTTNSLPLPPLITLHDQTKLPPPLPDFFPPFLAPNFSPLLDPTTPLAAPLKNPQYPNRVPSENQRIPCSSLCVDWVTGKSYGRRMGCECQRFDSTRCRREVCRVVWYGCRGLLGWRRGGGVK